MNQFPKTNVFTAECLATSGNDDLRWFAASPFLDDLIERTRSFQINTVINVNGTSLTLTYPDNNSTTLVIEDVTLLADTFKCYSQESSVFVYFTVTTSKRA